MDYINYISVISTIIAAPLSAWLTAVLLRKKYNAEVEQLRAQITATQASTKSDELSNVREGISILMGEIVEPLKKELNAIRKELTRFRKALEKGVDCELYDRCPIRHELQRSENSGGNIYNGRHSEGNGNNQGHSCEC